MEAEFLSAFVPPARHTIMPDGRWMVGETASGLSVGFPWNSPPPNARTPHVHGVWWWCACFSSLVVSLLYSQSYFCLTFWDSALVPFCVRCVCQLVMRTHTCPGPHACAPQRHCLDGHQKKPRARTRGCSARMSDMSRRSRCPRLPSRTSEPRRAAARHPLGPQWRL